MKKIAGAAEFQGMRTRLLEWRARRIADPIERLRFLQRAAARPMRCRSWVPGAVVAGLLASPYSGPPAASERVDETPRAAAPGAVWLVERGEDYELYSSGLRIETAWAVAGRPRSYPLFSRAGQVIGWQRVPAGIVFHSSESDLAAFEPDQVRLVVRQSRELLAYARRHGLYHFVIDRVGRVYRIVHEECAAAHAGRSVWADAAAVYLNLNQSFLGVCFEAHGPPALTAAQVQAGRALTELLRSQYGFDAGNCVAHGQVSVNPSNWRMGYHTDWAASLPFAALGLPENYHRPPAAVALFGFESDGAYRAASGEPLRRAVAEAEAALCRTAAAGGISPGRLRTELRKAWRAADSYQRGAE